MIDNHQGALDRKVVSRGRKGLRKSQSGYILGNLPYISTRNSHNVSRLFKQCTAERRLLKITAFVMGE